MNRELVDKIARAVLYEGYILYPYRPSVKNHQRWTFGGLYPKEWSEFQKDTDPCFSRTECLIAGDESASVDVAIRFLHLTDRTVAKLETPIDEIPPQAAVNRQLVPSIEICGKQYRPWQEAVERDVSAGSMRLIELAKAGVTKNFEFPSLRTVEPLRDGTGKIIALLIREQQALWGTIEISAVLLAPGLHKLIVRTSNQTLLDLAESRSRDDALLRSLISMHVILGCTGGAFVSLTDAPQDWHAFAAQCQNIGSWPVLIGTGTEHDTMLSSPIILYDYPQLAPESPGDLFDGTEIDEILTLRILTLTDEEKRSAASVDDRTRAMMARTESLAREQLAGLHGVMRGLTPVGQPQPKPPFEPQSEPQLDPLLERQSETRDGTDWNPFGAFEESAKLPAVMSGGVEIRPGDRVTLRPLARADIFDIALEGMTATVVSIEQDFENKIHLAVTVNDDPGEDLGLTGKPGHRFFFGIDEVEPITNVSRD